MPMTSNIDDVARWLTSVMDNFRFDEPGINESMGYDCGVAIAEGIQERAYKEQAGAKQVWRVNSEPYKTWKGEHYAIELTNFRTTQMLSMGSLTANMYSEDGGKTFVMNYGTGEIPTSSLTGYLDADDEITDKKKASIAHDDNREFFELDQTIVNDRVMPIVQEVAEAYFKKASH